MVKGTVRESPARLSADPRSLAMVGPNDMNKDESEVAGGGDPAVAGTSDSDSDSDSNRACALHMLEGFRMVERMKMNINRDFRAKVRANIEMVEMTRQRDDVQNKYNNALQRLAQLDAKDKCMKKKFNTLLAQKEELTQLKLELNSLQLKYNDIIQKIVKKNDQKKYTDVLPITPQPSTSSSGTVNSNLAEPFKKKGVKRKNRQAAIKQPDTNILEPTQTKRPRTRSQRAKLGNISETQKPPTLTSADHTRPENGEPGQTATIQPDTNLLKPTQTKWPRTRSSPQANPGDFNDNRCFL